MHPEPCLRPPLDRAAFDGVHAIRRAMDRPPSLVPPDIEVLLAALEVHVIGGDAHESVVDRLRDAFLELVEWHGVEWTYIGPALAAFATLRMHVAKMRVGAKSVL